MVPVEIVITVVATDIWATDFLPERRAGKIPASTTSIHFHTGFQLTSIFILLPVDTQVFHGIILG
jgi:hypothetical protein